MYYLTGVCLILISGSSFGTLAIFARVAYEDGITPMALIIEGMMIILAMIILARSEAPASERAKSTNGGQSLE